MPIQGPEQKDGDSDDLNYPKKKGDGCSLSSSVDKKGKRGKENVFKKI